MVKPEDWTYQGEHGALAARQWRALDRPPAYLLLLAHGYGEHTGRYQYAADTFVADGAAVYAVDHEGHGQSEGERALIPDFETVVTDLRRLDEQARDAHPGLPVVLVGHSMGGLIAARFAQRYGDTLAAVVLSGPLIGDWAAGPAMLAMDEIPDVPLDISTLSRDPSVGRSYQQDPLVWHGKFKRPTVEALQRAVRAVADGPSLGSIPLLYLHGEQDALVPMAGSQVGISHLAGTGLETVVYPGAKHEIFNEINRDEVLGDVVAFIRRVLMSSNV